MDYITFDKIQKSFGFEKLLDSVSFKICKGEHIGLIGNNGSGKTTLFKLIMGLESPDDGLILRKKRIIIGYLEQETSSYNQLKVIDVLKKAFETVLGELDELHKLTELLEKSTGAELERALTRYGTLQALIEVHKGYEIGSSIDAVSFGLGVSKSWYERKMANLSGGERTRVFLSKLLLEEPDILLLDEPTNHLDMIAVDWLEKYLNKYRGTIISISHDRVFLDNTVDKTFEIENGKITVYPGNFTWAREEKIKNMMLLQKHYDNQQKEIKRLDRAAKRMREWAKRADNPFMFKKAVNIERRIDHMDKIDKPSPEYNSMNLELMNKSKSGKEIIRTIALSKAYGQKALFDSVDFLLRRREKAVISGENGCGKTTFLKILTGEIKPDSGSGQIGSGVSYGLLRQEIIFEDGTRSILDEVRRSLLTDGNTARRILAAYGFRGENVTKQVSELSGGEQKRLRLSILMQKKYNLLIMDEPTNHMDINSREILEDAIMDYEGSCLFISHDRYFIRKVCDRKLLMTKQTLIDYEGDYMDIISGSEKPAKPKKFTKKIIKAEKLSKNKSSLLDELEIKIHQTETKIEHISLIMNEMTDYEKLKVLMDEKITLEQICNSLYDKWHKNSHIIS